MYLSQVGDKSSPELTQCLCTHLTLFGSSFFVMPNYVDISKTAELFATVNQNYVVLALLCVFYGLYLATLMWACYADRRASSKVRRLRDPFIYPTVYCNYSLEEFTAKCKRSNSCWEHI